MVKGIRYSLKGWDKPVLFIEYKTLYVDVLGFLCGRGREWTTFLFPFLLPNIFLCFLAALAVVTIRREIDVDVEDEG